MAIKRVDEATVPSVRRRELLGGLAMALAAAGTADSVAQASPASPNTGSAALRGNTIRFVDLTHTLTAAFNFNPLQPRIAMDPIVGSGYSVGMNLNRVLMIEHTGTHLDVPRHFDPKAASVGDVSIRDLVVPLAVIDISQRFATDRDAALEPADIERWESVNGPLPSGCCVAVHSGWDPVADNAKRQSLPPDAARRVPGVGIEAAHFLAEKRSVKGIAVDAMSIDRGTDTPAYPVHQFWLRSGRWAIEYITNLRAVPPAGALLIVGVPPVAQATGFPVRALALF